MVSNLPLGPGIREVQLEKRVANGKTTQLDFNLFTHIESSVRKQVLTSQYVQISKIKDSKHNSFGSEMWHFSWPAENVNLLFIL